MAEGPRRSLGAVGVALLGVGLLGWAWLGDWRWAVTGGALLLACAAFSETGRRLP